MKNKQVLLKERPVGMTTADTWQIQEVDLPQLKEGEYLTQIKYISIDPAMRGWIDDKPSYLPPVKLGEVMRAGTIGVVAESKNEKFEVGDWIMGWQGVQSFAVADGSREVNLKDLVLPPEKYLAVLGLPGYTAYFGLLDIGNPKEGETVFVSGAAGAVGSIVGQIAKLKGLNVIGTAGSDEKCNYCIKELGFDSCINYKNEDAFDQLRKATKGGIDIYFDNVGGKMLDFALSRLKFKGRVVLCGAISQYNNTTPVKGPSNYLSLLVNRGKMEGFIVMDYKARYQEAALQMSQWMAEGKLISREQIEKGLDQFPSAFNLLFSGDKRGKLILEV